MFFVNVDSFTDIRAVRPNDGVTEDNVAVKIPSSCSSR